MKIFLAVFVFLFSAMLLAAQNRVYVSDSINVRDGKQYYIHFVKQGQTVYSIAKAYNVSVDEIFYENPEAKEGIHVDQVLWVPTVNKETELNREVKKTGFKFFYHLAKDNQDFHRLSQLYHVPESTIRQANPRVKEPFRDGEYVKIPVVSIVESRKEKKGSGDVSFNPEIKVIPDYRHVVKTGETEYSIARKYNVTVGQLRAVNPMLYNGLHVGDRLRIPEGDQTLTATAEKQKEAQQKPDYYRHKVKKKETLYSISRLYGVEIQDILAANPGITTSISTGQIIKIPKTKISKPYIIYVATKKTKLSKVARMYKVPLNQVISANPSLSKKIYAGQRVRIPVGKIARRQMEEKEKKEKALEEKEKAYPEATPSAVFGCRKPGPHPKKVYKVALMIPFFLEETDSLDIENFLQEKQPGFLPFRFIEFYEGALMAVDSLKKLGMNIELYVYDVDKNLTKTAKALQKPEMKTMDLIIGPFYNYSFAQVALFASTFNIPIVNPLTFREEIMYEYPTAIKVKPGKRFQTELVPLMIEHFYPGYKVFLIAHTAYKDADLVTNMANGISAKLPPQVKVSNNDLYNLTVAVAHRDEEYEEGSPLPAIKYEGLDIYPDIIEANIDDSTVVNNGLIKINYASDSLHPFLDNASPVRKNLVILYGDNKAFIMDAMNRLNEYRDTFDIQLIGMPDIEGLSSFDYIQANNMNLTYFSSFYLDYDSPDVQDFVLAFRQNYATDPDIYGFSGYDVTRYFLQALYFLDKRFSNCLQVVPMKLLMTNYRFKKVRKTENYENSYWNILRYQNLELIKLPDLVPPEKQ